MLGTMLSRDSAVKRQDLSGASVWLPFDSMSESTPGEDSTLGERLNFAIHHERHRGPTAVENALMLKNPEMFRSRGFLSSYINGRRGVRFPDPKAMKAIADYLHVAFEWLVLGTGPMRRGGRGGTPAEEALFVARDWGIREDAFEVAWERNKDRSNEMTAEEWFEEIRSEAERLNKKQVPRPESIVNVKDEQRRMRRAKSKIARTLSAPSVSEQPARNPAIPPPRRVATK